MNNANYLAKGDYNTKCDRCGQKYKRTQCNFEWTGLLTCFHCWDPRHPWTLPRPIIIEGLPVPDSRPEPNDNPLAPSIYLGMGVWGQYYINQGGLGLEIKGNDLIWGQWNMTWGGESNVIFSASTFPLT